MKKLLGIFICLVFLFTIWSYFKKGILNSPNLFTKKETQTVVHEESSLIKAIDESLPSVVTVGISKTSSNSDSFEINPLDPFSPFRRKSSPKEKIERNIGSGFIISKDGLIVTNKHVVADTESTYQVLTNDDKKYDVVKISRDPLNDLAILKINARDLKPLRLGDSSNLKLGQLVVAVGTPLGEFKNTVTSGIISGLGRGINAGSPFEEYVERLDNVIQTDAAINPGNSGGPLINLKGEAIGVNTAVSAEGQNLGFAIPINVVSELIKNFQTGGGQIQRAFLGVRYKMIDKQTAILNEIVEGAYIIQVIEGGPAQKAGLQEEDVIIEFDGKKIKGEDDQALQKLIAEKKVGDGVKIKIWRSGETKQFQITLRNFD